MSSWVLLDYIKLDLMPLLFLPWKLGGRLAQKYWNHGYATEAALAVIDWGFTAVGPTGDCILHESSEQSFNTGNGEMRSYSKSRR
jgi:hypothetical protein